MREIDTGFDALQARNASGHAEQARSGFLGVAGIGETEEDDVSHHGCCTLARIVVKGVGETWARRVGRPRRRHTGRMGISRRRWGRIVGSAPWVLIGGTWVQACGSDHPDFIPACENNACPEAPTVVTGSEGRGTGGEATGGTGGSIEEAPPAGSPAEGLGVGGSLAAGGGIGVAPTIGVDGIQPVPTGFPEPGAAPALPGPDDALSPPPGAAVDPTTGLEPPRTGVVDGTPPGAVVDPTLPQREPTERDFTF